jgi:hypothetical protein
MDLEVAEMVTFGRTDAIKTAGVLIGLPFAKYWTRVQPILDHNSSNRQCDYSWVYKV